MKCCHPWMFYILQFLEIKTLRLTNHCLLFFGIRNPYDQLFKNCDIFFLIIYVRNDYEMLLSLDENNHRHAGASTNRINSLPQSTVQVGRMSASPF